MSKASALIDRAHLVMLPRPGILTIEQARPIAQALEAIDRELDRQRSDLYRRGGGFLLPDREGTAQAPRVPTSPAACTRRARATTSTTPCSSSGSSIASTPAGTHGAAGRDPDFGGGAGEQRRSSSPIPMASRRSRPSSAIISPPFIETLLRDIARLEAARDIVDRSPMGAAAITTTGFPIDRDADGRSPRLQPAAAELL